MDRGRVHRQKLWVDVLQDLTRVYWWMAQELKKKSHQLDQKEKKNTHAERRILMEKRICFFFPHMRRDVWATKNDGGPGVLGGLNIEELQHRSIRVQQHTQGTAQAPGYITS